MRAHQLWLQSIAKLGLVLMVVVSMNAEAGWFGLGGTSWAEEALQHDGSKIDVEREADRGGRHEIGQQPPIKEQSLTFTLPTTDKRITWRSEFSKDVGLADLEPIAINIVQGTAYVVSSPVGCLAYNKWGRPNPPYVVFRYESREWKRIPLKELPAEIKIPNLIISSPDNAVESIGKPIITSETINRLNNELTQPELRAILRVPLVAGQLCPQYSSGPKAPTPITPNTSPK